VRLRCGGCDDHALVTAEVDVVTLGEVPGLSFIGAEMRDVAVAAGHLGHRADEPLLADTSTQARPAPMPMGCTITTRSAPVMP